MPVKAIRMQIIVSHGILKPKYSSAFFPTKVNNSKIPIIWNASPLYFKNEFGVLLSINFDLLLICHSAVSVEFAT